MEITALSCWPQCATLFREIGLTVCSLGEKPV
jgi:hypothetical protein